MRLLITNFFLAQSSWYLTHLRAFVCQLSFRQVFASDLCGSFTQQICIVGAGIAVQSIVLAHLPPFVAIW